MIATPMDVLTVFPVRKSKRQKAAFRAAAGKYAASLGYPVQEERGSFGCRNLIIGDPEQAEYLITAHYDTCARLPFPNFLTPCSLWLFLLYQLVVGMGILLAAVAAAVGAAALSPPSSRRPAPGSAVHPDSNNIAARTNKTGIPCGFLNT